MNILYILFGAFSLIYAVSVWCGGDMSPLLTGCYAFALGVIAIRKSFLEWILKDTW